MNPSAVETRQRLVQLLGAPTPTANREVLRTRGSRSTEVGEGIPIIVAKELVAIDAQRHHHRDFIIAETLARIDAGTFGTCMACEEDIPEKRIKAMFTPIEGVPGEASTCVSAGLFCCGCQELVDRGELSGFEHFRFEPPRIRPRTFVC